MTAAYTDAENKVDVAAVAALYTNDGEVVSPFGNVITKSGKKEIEQYYQAALKLLKDRHAEIKLDEASQIGADAAIGAGNFGVTGKAQNGDAVKRAGLWTAVYVLGRGRVKNSNVDSVREPSATGVISFVRDASGQALAYACFEDEPGRRAAAKLMTRDEGAADRREHCEVAGVAAVVTADAVGTLIAEPPAQNRTCGFPACGSHLGRLTEKHFRMRCSACDTLMRL